MVPLGSLVERYPDQVFTEVKYTEGVTASEIWAKPRINKLLAAASIDFQFPSSVQPNRPSDDQLIS